MNAAELPFDADTILDGLRIWIECESPTYDAPSVNRMMDVASRELVIAGAKPRRDAITGRDALTASELRVARLAAQGLTNREIAQSLFITTKTASTHLSHIYRKLEISRRGQLAEALAGQIADPSENPAATPAAIS